MKKLDNIRLPLHIHSAVREAADRLRTELPVSKVVLFGSQAKGQADTDSDIDLLVLTACPVTPDIKGKIRDILFEIDLKNDVVLTAITMNQQQWDGELISGLLIHQEVEKDGCLV